MAEYETKLWVADKLYLVPDSLRDYVEYLEQENRNLEAENRSLKEALRQAFDGDSETEEDKDARDSEP